VDAALASFVEQEVLPGTGIEAHIFWSSFSELLRELSPENRQLLQKREALQALIDERNEALGGTAPEPAEEEAFLRSIGYIVDTPAPFTIATENVDPEVATIAGPQLVVPVNNARYALNAVNARWASLYDALYGTDAMGDLPQGGALIQSAGPGGGLGPSISGRNRAADRRQPCGGDRLSRRGRQARHRPRRPRRSLAVRRIVGCFAAAAAQ
jgi:malate synthase